VKKGRYCTRAGCLNSAFTLIELLVVIAIIGILLAILIPSLKKAKEQVRTVICRTHLKGIGTAILIYLDQNNGRSYDYTRPDKTIGANQFLWYEPTNRSRYIDPRHPDAYWGVAYINYTDTPDVFGCPSYMKIPELLYGADPELCRQAGYALNENFHNRKVSEIRSTSTFIVAHDHVEPRIEGGGGQGDTFAIDTGQKMNLTNYRPAAVSGKGGREQYYSMIFRHNKRNVALDDPAQAATRVPEINRNPNGLANILWLDGHADAIHETTGENVNLSWYTGQQ
jgi:prepilin-type N-terminal cleavage/methylation domain-containing protein/prepilin-type processing-associated H-X9-DG protein